MNINITFDGDNMTLVANNKRALITKSGGETYIDDDGRIWEDGEAYFDVDLYEDDSLIDVDTFTAMNLPEYIAEAKDKAILRCIKHLI